MVNEWLKDRPEWTFLFTPISSSRMNAVEGFFSKLASQRLKHAIFDSIDKCIAAVEGCIERHNANGSCPFRWSRKSSRQLPQPTSSALGPDRIFCRVQLREQINIAQRYSGRSPSVSIESFPLFRDGSDKGRS